jgi:hypothetical protein
MGKYNTSVLNLRKDNQDLLTAPVDLLDKSLEESVNTDFNVDDITSYAAERYKLSQIGGDENVPNPIQQGNKAGILAGYAQQLNVTPEEARQNPMVYEAMKGSLNEGMNTEGQMLDIAQPDQFPGQDAKFAEDIPMSEDAELEAANRRSAINDLGSTTSQEWTDNYRSDLNVEQASAMHSSIEGFLNLGNKVQESMGNIANRLKGRNADRFNAVTIANEINASTDLKLDPKTVGEYANGFINSYAQIEEQGFGRTFTDIGLAAGLKAASENEWINQKRRENPSNDFLENSDNIDQGFSAGMDAKVGRMAHQALGIKSTPQMDAIGGAIFRKTLADSLPELFETKMVDTGSGKMAQVTTLKDSAKGQIDGMQDLLDTMMPDTLREIRHIPNVDKSSFTSPKKADKSKDHGDFTFVNETIDVLGNTGHGMAYSLSDPLTTGNVLEEVLLSDAPALAGKDWMKLKNDPTTGEPHPSNDIKMRGFAREIDFAKTHSGKKLFWDHNLGANNRFYMYSVAHKGATAGNFHSSKIARAMLEAMVPETYSLGNGSADLIQLKAGIMLKFGSKIVDKRRGVHKTSKELAVEFDNNAVEWSRMLATPELVKGNAHKIAEISGEHEGPISVSAMVEGARLLRAINAGDSQYRSKFYTEIDGIANGVAHNALQSGANGPKGGRILSATGLFTPKALKAMADGTFKPEDVYEITVDAALNALKGASSRPERKAKIDAILQVLTDPNGNSLIDRNFGKKPMMIFGYGAGKETIQLEVDAWVDNILSDTTKGDLAGALEATGYTVDDVKVVLGWGVNEGVKNDFDVVKKLNEVMQGLAEAAINSGVAPTYTTREGHIINFGQWFNEVDTSVEGIPVKYKKGVDKGIRVDAYARKKGIEPFSVTNPVNKKTGEVTRKVGQKAISQAGVLTTQAQDGINIGMTMQALDKLYPSGGARAAQIFDAVMATPKRGGMVAKQLNNDFYKLNKEWSMVEEFMRELVAKGTNVPVKLQDKVADILSARRDLFRNLQAAGVNQFPWPK